MIGVHGTSYTIQGKNKKCDSYHQSMMVHHWSAVWRVWMSPFPWLHIQWCTNLTHAHIDGLAWVSIPVWMVELHGISHTIQGRSKKCPSFYLVIHIWYISWVLCDQYGCDPLVWLLMQWYINLIHVPIDELRGGVSTPIWVVGAHGISHTIQGRG